MHMRVHMEADSQRTYMACCVELLCGANVPLVTAIMGWWVVATLPTQAQAGPAARGRPPPESRSAAHQPQAHE